MKDDYEKTKEAWCAFMEWKQAAIREMTGIKYRYFTKADRDHIMSLSGAHVVSLMSASSLANVLPSDAIFCPFCLLATGHCKSCRYHSRCERANSTYRRIVASLGDPIHIAIGAEVIKEAFNKVTDTFQREMEEYDNEQQNN